MKNGATRKANIDRATKAEITTQTAYIFLCRDRKLIRLVKNSIA